MHAAMCNKGINVFKKGTKLLFLLMCVTFNPLLPTPEYHLQQLQKQL